jgi:hypothetical protein
VSRLRPLARRRLSTFRPALVFMRSRKPCVFFRRLRFGWNVLFIDVRPFDRRACVVYRWGRIASRLLTLLRPDLRLCYGRTLIGAAACAMPFPAHVVGARAELSSVEGQELMKRAAAGVTIYPQPADKQAVQSYPQAWITLCVTRQEWWCHA